MTDKTLYGLRANQRHKEIRGVFNSGIWPPATIVCDAVDYIHEVYNVLWQTHYMDESRCVATIDGFSDNKSRIIIRLV